MELKLAFPIINQSLGRASFVPLRTSFKTNKKRQEALKKIGCLM